MCRRKERGKEMPASAWVRRRPSPSVIRATLFSVLTFVSLPTAARAADVPPPASARVCAAEDGTMPRNIVLREPFDEVTREMLALSPTFRAQCARLAEGGDGLLVIVRLDMQAPRQFAARTLMGRTPEGSLLARMMVRLQPDYTEIIAHEFEHVVEQLDQWQLRTMALAKGEAAGHVHEVAPEVFETERAIRIGQLVEAEVFAARRSRSTTTHEASAVVEHVTVTTHHAGS